MSAVGPNRLEGIAGQCYYANDWRVFARIESGGRPARTWVSIDPVAASEPTDRAIQVALVVAPAVPSFGYCAPVEGLEMPPAGLVAQAWKVVRGTATPIRLDPAGQVFPEDRPTHALWGPLAGADGRRPDSWPGGQYVIRLTGPDPAVYDRWFGVEMVLIAEPGARSPGTSPGGSRSPTPGGSSSPQP